MGIVAHCEIQEKHLDRNDSFKAFRFSLAVAAYSPTLTYKLKILLAAPGRQASATLLTVFPVSSHSVLRDKKTVSIRPTQS